MRIYCAADHWPAMTSLAEAHCGLGGEPAHLWRSGHLLRAVDELAAEGAGKYAIGAMLALARAIEIGATDRRLVDAGLELAALAAVYETRAAPTIEAALAAQHDLGLWG